MTEAEQDTITLDNSVEDTLEDINLHETQEDQFHAESTLAKQQEQQSLYSRITSFTASQLFAHILLITNTLLYGGFCVIAPMSIKTFNAVLFASFRTGIIAVTVLPMALIIDRKYKFRQFEDSDSKHWILKSVLSKIPAGKHLILLIACGMIITANIATYIVSLGLTSPTIVSIISPISTVFTCIIAVFLKREGKSILKFAGVILAVLGSMSMLVVAAFLDKSGQSQEEIENSRLNTKSLLACGLMLVNALGSATVLNIQKGLLDQGVPPFTMTGYTLSVASLLSATVSSFFLPQFHPTQVPSIGWIGLLYSGIIVGSVSFVISGYASRIASATVVSVYGTSMPVVSALFLYVFLGETVTWMVGIGGIIIAAGVTMVGIAKRRESQQQQLTELEQQNAKNNMITDITSDEQQELVSALDGPLQETIEEETTDVTLKDTVV
jgi:drug/metabolite transporter (DMT)-like permease